MSFHREQTLALLQRIVRDIKAGYEPDFVAVAYSLAGSKLTAKVFGYRGLDNAHTLHEVLNTLDDELGEFVVKQATGLTAEDIREAQDQFDRDVEEAAKRASDRLVKDKPVTDLKQAQEMLGKIIKAKS